MNFRLHVDNEEEKRTRQKKSFDFVFFLGLEFFETSAKENINVKSVFERFDFDRYEKHFSFRFLKISRYYSGENVRCIG